jgi:hypothetical protein
MKSAQATCAQISYSVIRLKSSSRMQVFPEKESIKLWTTFVVLGLTLATTPILDTLYMD